MSDSVEQTPPLSAVSQALTQENGVPGSVLVDPLGDDRFRGRANQDNGFGKLYGGQLLSQSLGAASATVGGRPAHSMHCYFLRPGVFETPVDYLVERIRDGRSFSTRRVTAMQGDRPICISQSSFRDPQPGYEHQRAPLWCSSPDELHTIAEIARNGPPDTSQGAKLFGESPMGKLLDVRAGLHNATPSSDRGSLRQYWLRTPIAAPVDDPAVRQQVIAWLSDFWLSASGLMPHDGAFPVSSLTMGSIDHAIWFHHPVSVEQWLLYETESPFASDGTSVSRGLLFDQDGRMIASCVQEFLQVTG